MAVVRGVWPPKQDDKVSGGGDDGGMDSDARLAKLEAVIPTLATKSDLAELRADMHEMNSGISRWMLGTVLSVIGTVVLGFAGLGLTTYNALKPTPAPVQSAPAAAPAPPIIINNLPPAAPAPAPRASRP